jgi:TolA-binding protein
MRKRMVEYSALEVINMVHEQLCIERYEALKERVDKLEENNKEITKLSTLMEIQIEMNKQQSETLSKINDNLTSLNNVTGNLDRRIGDLEVGFTQEKERNKIDLRDVGKNIVIGLAMGTLGALLARHGIPFIP